MMHKEDIVAVTSRSFSKNDTLINKLRAEFPNSLINDSGNTLEGQELIKFLYPAKAAIIGIEKLDKETIDQLPNLKHISKYGVGTDNIDLAYLKKKNLTISLHSGSNSLSVAEYALSLILISLKRSYHAGENLKNKLWTQIKGLELSGKSVGILGFGNIGRQLYRLIEPFDCKVRIFDSITIENDDLREGDVQTNLNEIFDTSDVISIHLPLIPHTRNLINKCLFKRSKDTLIIVNTSRGGIVNEGDLFAFLTQNQNAFASFDVFEKEPDTDSQLHSLKNFFGTPHMASLTNEAILKMGISAIDGLNYE